MNNDACARVSVCVYTMYVLIKRELFKFKLTTTKISERSIFYRNIFKLLFSVLYTCANGEKNLEYVLKKTSYLIRNDRKSRPNVNKIHWKVLQKKTLKSFLCVWNNQKVRKTHHESAWFAFAVVFTTLYSCEIQTWCQSESRSCIHVFYAWLTF